MTITKMDWKYALSLVAAVIGLIIPIQLWRADLGSHSLQLQVISQTPLQVSGAALLKGLQITLDGKPVENLYLTVLKLVNNGSKPILPTDFESPLEISTTNNSKLYDLAFPKSNLRH